METAPAPNSGPVFSPTVPPGPKPQPQPQVEPLPLSASEIAPHLTFWQLPWVQNLLPLITSLSIHLAIIIIALLIGGAVNEARKMVVQEQVVVPDASFTDGEVGGIPNPGLGGDPNRAAAQDQFKDVAVNSDGWANKPSQTLSASLMGGGQGDKPTEMSIIGEGPNVGAGKGSGTGQGSGLGQGTGDGSGPLAAFGVPGGGGGIGPKFMGQGTGGNTHSIAFVCDASGSMMNKMVPLKNELKRTIDQLRVMQAFSVIFFADQKPQALAQQLVMASPDNKRKAYDFLQNVSTAGQTDPIPALDLAFKQKPQLIFFLTDGDFPDNNAVLTHVRKLNKDHTVKINTIAFVGDSDNDVEFIKILTDIAKENGGLFKKVSQDEVQ